MNWLRLHHEARADKKLQALSDKQFRVWFNLLCYASEQKVRGVVPFDDAYLVAVEVARGDVDLLTKTVEQLVKLKILSVSGESIEFINFGKRQYDKPSDSPERVAERVRKHRQNGSNADVTPSNARDTDTDTDTDTETNRERENARAPVSLPQVPKKGPIPPDWQPSQAAVLWAMNRSGLAKSEITEEIEHFRNHYLANGESMLDWEAKWRGWVQKIPNNPKLNALRSPPANGRASPSALDFAAKARELERQGL